MQAEAQTQQLKTTLAELETLHLAETVALRKLSREALDELTDRKLELSQRLTVLSAEGVLQPEHRAQLERIKRAALLNQMLLHHARDAVLGILQAASGDVAHTSHNGAAALGGLRVDFRG